MATCYRRDGEPVPYNMIVLRIDKLKIVSAKQKRLP